MEEKILLVNEKDEPIVYEEKMKTHIDAKLHRAFSIFIFNSKNEMLIQRRALDKYHCGGLWTNTCCSHQRENEILTDAIHRRLKEEMGFDTELFELFTFHYKVNFENGLTENEIDHVFIGNYDGKIKINPKEAYDYKWIKLEKLKEWVKQTPENFTPWFLIAIEKMKEYKNNLFILERNGKV